MQIAKLATALGEITELSGRLTIMTAQAAIDGRSTLSAHLFRELARKASELAREVSKNSRSKTSAPRDGQN